MGAFDSKGACNGNFAVAVANIIYVTKMKNKLEHSITKHYGFQNYVINVFQFIMCHNDATH